MATGNASAQNNVITSAEYQQAADEITAIINAQRAERAPIEAQQELLQNRQEILIARRQSALNTLQAAEAAPSETAFLEASRTAYARATGEVEATNAVIQQNRSILAQSRQSTAELQEQRGRLEVNADLAAKGAPTLNSLPPPATVVPAEPPSYVAPPDPPVLTQSRSIPQPAAPVPPLAPAGQNNVSVADQWGETELEISSAARGIRAENAAIAANIESLQSQQAAAARADRALENQVIDARLSGASSLEISQLEAQQNQAVARTSDITNQIQRQESVLGQNQQTLSQLEQQRFIAQEAQFAASSGTPSLNSVPPPATVVPAQSPSYVPPPPPPVQTQIAPAAQPDPDPVIPQAAAQTNVSASQQWLDAEDNISRAARGVRAENAAIAANIESLQSQQAAAARADRALENQVIDARLAGASSLEISQLEAQQIQAAARTADIGNQIQRQESVLAQNQQTLGELNEQQNIAEQAYFVTRTGSPLVLSAPGPATVEPGADPAAYDLPPTTYADNFSPGPVAADGDAALQAFEDAQAEQLAQQEGVAFAVPTQLRPVAASGDEALQAFEDAQAEQLAQQEGVAFATPESIQQGQTRALVQNAQQQNTLNDRVALPQAADWRVRLSLANTASYLYRAEPAGILAPLARTNGVVFPYTPSIETSYQAKYDAVDLTHSNYKGYFYKNSSVDQVSIRGTFTAQDTREAEYLLAVIAFFRSVTKMFYGATDPLAGTPPPLVFLSGLGQYQFNNNPCVVSSFNYSLPSDVDYIRANGFNNYGINLDNRRQQSSGPPATGILGAIATVNRLRSNFLAPGAIKSNGVAASPVSANNSKTNYTNSTYVPTKMEINVTLLPIQTRSQISSQFNLQKFATGSLLQQGFW